MLNYIEMLAKNLMTQNKISSHQAEIVIRRSHHVVTRNDFSTETNINENNVIIGSYVVAESYVISLNEVFITENGVITKNYVIIIRELTHHQK
jgi:hypothetical protein